MKPHLQPIIQCAGSRRPTRIPRTAWIRLAIGIAAFSAAATLALHLIRP